MDAPVTESTWEIVDITDIDPDFIEAMDDIEFADCGFRCIGPSEK